jgi:molybdate transport system permease protein
MLTSDDLSALWLTAKLAGSVTVILLLIGTPLAWWLARTSSWCKAIIASVISLPMVLPPVVFGFYLLILTGPHGPLGKLFATFGLKPLPFTFEGLVVGSVFYSLPFMVHPLRAAFESIGNRPLEVAATLHASPLDTFITVVLPLALPGFISASIITFAHTVGEFGMILMIGGSLPGITRVASVQIYDYVESMDFSSAHHVAIVMLLFSFVILLVMHLNNPKSKQVAE